MSSSASSASLAPQFRSLYRSLLRELPSRRLSSRSPVHARLRASLTAPPPSTESVKPNLQAAREYLGYVRAQRMYATLLERYNPGHDMGEEERVRLSARRVGMNLPEQYR